MVTGAGILVLLAGGVYIAPFVIGAMLPNNLIERDLIPIAAGATIVSICIGIWISLGDQGEQWFGSRLAPWLWVPCILGLPAGYLFGVLCRNSIRKNGT